METEPDHSNAKGNVEEGEHVITGVPLHGGPEDGNFDDGLICDGELCGKIYYTETYESYVHCYNLVYNHDEGFKFIYDGLKPFRQNEDGDFFIEEDEDGR